MLVGALGCARLPANGPVVAVASVPRAPEVRFRPFPYEGGEDGAKLVSSIPGAQWDAGLQEATDALMALIVDRTARLDPSVTTLVTARAGYPGLVRYTRIINGGVFPESLIEDIVLASGGVEVDVALARRDYSDGVSLWVIAWSPRRAELDPIPRDLELDSPISVRVDPADKVAELRLFVAPPTGAVEELSLTAGVSRWVDLFHAPGRYRVEVVADRGGGAQVLLLWSVFVDGAPAAPRRLAQTGAVPPDPAKAEAWLYDALDELRDQQGLPAVRRFPEFEPLAREHSALMAAQNRVAHKLPGVTRGVAARARTYAHPMARHHENVAAAATAADAFTLVRESPGHLANLLCVGCNAASIGAALEPVLDRPPRLFVTWELLEFPEGPPRKLMTPGQ